MATVKEEANKLLERLPDEASWDDLMYEIYVQKKIDMGLKAAEAGKLIPHEEVKRRLLGKWKSSGRNAVSMISERSETT